MNQLRSSDDDALPVNDQHATLFKIVRPLSPAVTQWLLKAELICHFNPPKACHKI